MEYGISQQLINILERNDIYIDEDTIPTVNGGYSVIEITVSTDLNEHSFKVAFNVDKNTWEADKRFLEAIEDYIGDVDEIQYKVADQYFRNNLQTINIKEAMEYGEDIAVALKELLHTVQMYVNYVPKD